MVMAVQAHLSLTLSAPRAERGSAHMRFPNPDAAVIVIAQTLVARSNRALTCVSSHLSLANAATTIKGR